MPVRPRWVESLSLPEALAVDGDRLYVFDETAMAFRLEDGALIWDTYLPWDEGLASDGGARIGADGPGRIRFWAWYNENLVVDARTGEMIDRGPGGPAPPPTFREFRAPRPDRYDVDTTDLGHIVARGSDGRVAWSITVPEPQFDPVPAIAVPGGLVLLTSDAHVVVLDYVDA